MPDRYRSVRGRYRPCCGGRCLLARPRSGDDASGVVDTDIYPSLGTPGTVDLSRGEVAEGIDPPGVDRGSLVLEPLYFLLMLGDCSEGSDVLRRRASLRVGGPCEQCCENDPHGVPRVGVKSDSPEYPLRLRRVCHMFEQGLKII